jgi:hypothetical protein
MKTKAELEKEYVDSYKEPPIVFTLLMSVGMLFCGILCIVLIYYAGWIVLSLFNN